MQLYIRCNSEIINQRLFGFMSSSRLENIWYEGRPISLLLIPVSWLFCLLVMLRRAAYRAGILRTHRIGVPVIIVGNLTVGGTGKTPLVIWIANYLTEHGMHPGIVSRGYGGKARQWPQQVRRDSDPVVVGDEAVLIARYSKCPMAVGPDRVAAANALISSSNVDVILSDDGLQHYRLGRDIEILVLDGIRRFGNGFCLPAGPLREPLSRRELVDMVVVNGLGGRGEHSMNYECDAITNLHEPQKRAGFADFEGKLVHAVAGIAYPERFFSMLRRKGLRVIEHIYPDHHQFTDKDLQFGDVAPVLMTEKDAVKCERFAAANHWSVPVRAVVDDAFGVRLSSLLAEYQS